MLSFLLRRPIAVGMSFAALLIASLWALNHLPVSLLPSVEIPQLRIYATVPNRSATEIESAIMQPIREQLATLPGVEKIDSEASAEVGTLRLQFAYGADMQLAYLAANEQIDRLSTAFPEGVPRPQVVRLNTADIPVARLQILPQTPTNDLMAVSNLAEKVLKKRLESLEGVALVDINGIQRRRIRIVPHPDKLAAWGLSVAAIEQSLRENNQPLGAISVKDGQYRYFLQIEATLRSTEDVKALPLRLPGRTIQLAEVAAVSEETATPLAWHLFHAVPGVVVTLHKHPDAQMRSVMQAFYDTVRQFRSEFPHLRFAITQDQSVLLRTSIDNLQSALLYGGICAFLVLFFFLSNYRTAFIIGISLPSSLLLSFFFFYLFNLSINIISLSGMALGVGMLIDNAIIVLDNITRHWAQAERPERLPYLFRACVHGTTEVMSPLVSSVLTTLAVFVPLVFLNGLSGALFYDQALAIAITLGCSLAVSFVVLPLCYWIVFSLRLRRHRVASVGIGSENRVYRTLLKAYQWLHHRLFMVRLPAFLVMCALGASSYAFFQALPVQNLPSIERQEVRLTLDWNEPIEVATNKARVEEVLAHFQSQFLYAESEIGIPQFLRKDHRASVTYADLYFYCTDAAQRKVLEHTISEYFAQNYPQAQVEWSEPPNAFNQMFAAQAPYLALQLRPFQQKQPLPLSMLDTLRKALPTTAYQVGNGWIPTTTVLLSLHTDALARYGIGQQTVRERLSEVFQQRTATALQNFGERIPLVVQQTPADFAETLRNTWVYVQGGDGGSTGYRLSELVTHRFEVAYKSITADVNSLYQSVYFPEMPRKDAAALWATAQQTAKHLQQFTVSAEGTYFVEMENMQQMLFVLGVAVALLYFILAAQFESFVLPILVLLTLPLGIAGSMALLWLTGESLNMMSAIGMVVMLGIMVNDAILKIDTMNRLWRTSEPRTVQALRNAIALAGERRFKPIVMTSLTTILALTPLLFTTGLGADLQKPLAYAVIGGLTFGTFTALYFIPLGYYFLNRTR